MIGPIVGGVIGGVSFILLIILIVYLVRRQYLKGLSITSQNNNKVGIFIPSNQSRAVVNDISTYDLQNRFKNQNKEGIKNNLGSYTYEDGNIVSINDYYLSNKNMVNKL